MRKKCIANYADDTTPYSSGTDISTVIFELQGMSIKVFNWFANNHMKANPGKCHQLPCPEVVYIDRMQLTSSTAETLLGITIDSRPILTIASNLDVSFTNRQ